MSARSSVSVRIFLFTLSVAGALILSGSGGGGVGLDKALPGIFAEAAFSVFDDVCSDGEVLNAYAEQIDVDTTDDLRASDCRPAFSGDGLVFGVCDGSSSRRCIVCDRTSVHEGFDMDLTKTTPQCHAIEQPKDMIEFGRDGLVLSGNGLVFSTCDQDSYAPTLPAEHGDDATGSCYICRRTSVDDAFVVDSSTCQIVAPYDRFGDDQFGHGGPALSPDGLVFAACSAKAWGWDFTDNFDNAGACFVCSRTSVDIDFDLSAEESTMCHKLVPSDITAEHYHFGYDGPALSNNGLVFAACSGAGSTADRCYVCDRSSVDEDFSMDLTAVNPQCHTLAPSGGIGAGGPALSGDGLVFAVCNGFMDAGNGDKSGACYVCRRSSVDEDFDIDLSKPNPKCHMIAPSDGSADLQFGGLGPALAANGLVFAACNLKGPQTADGGSCYICERSSIEDNFDMDLTKSDSRCRKIAPYENSSTQNSGTEYKVFGGAGPALSSSGLVFSGCTAGSSKLALDCKFCKCPYNPITQIY